MTVPDRVRGIAMNFIRKYIFGSLGAICSESLLSHQSHHDTQEQNRLLNTNYLIFESEEELIDLISAERHANQNCIKSSHIQAISSIYMLGTSSLTSGIIRLLLRKESKETIKNLLASVSGYTGDYGAAILADLYLFKSKYSVVETDCYALILDTFKNAKPMKRYLNLFISEIPLFEINIMKFIKFRNSKYLEDYKLNLSSLEAKRVEEFNKIFKKYEERFKNGTILSEISK